MSHWPKATSKQLTFPCFKVVEKIKNYVSAHQLFAPQDILIVGVSGGKDSMTLLRFLQDYHEGALVIAHMNHGLRKEESHAEAQFVKSYAEAAGLTFVTETVDPKFWESKSAGNRQALARDCRRDFLISVAQSHQASCIVTAHHAQDQAETMLLHLLRGSGLAGLVGMKAQRLEAGIRWCRPFLCVTLEEVAVMMKEWQISFCEDSSNAKQDYDRNWFRHEIISRLQKKNPNLVSLMSETVELLRHDHEALEAIAQEDLNHLAQQEGAGWMVSLKDFLSLTKGRRYRVLRGLWARWEGSERLIGRHHIEKMDDLAHQSQPMAHYDLPSGAIFSKDYWKLTIGPKKLI